MINGIAALTKMLMYFISCNLEDIDKGTIIEVCSNFVTAIEKYQSTLGKTIIKNISKQTHFIMFMIGVIRGEFKWIEKIAQSLGLFDHKKVKDIIYIFMRFKEEIFSNDIYGLPALNYLKEKAPNFREGTKLVGKVLKGAVTEAKTKIVDKAKDKISELTNIPAEKIDKVANVVSDTITKGPTEMIVGAIFRHFDKDDSGYIDYDEF